MNILSDLYLCASSHKNGNSELLLKELIKITNFNGQILNITQDMEKAEEAFLKTIISGSNIIISFPLYVDAVPSYLLKFMKEIEEKAEDINAFGTIHIIANNGFFEPEQNNIAIKIIENWCKKCGFKMGRAMGVGGSGMIKCMPMGKGLLKKVGECIEEFAKSIKEEEKGDIFYTKPMFIRGLYIMGANSGFKAMGKKNGLSKKQMIMG